MSKLCKDCACENVCGITHLPEDKACVYYKAEAITELEKIKAEFLFKCKENLRTDKMTEALNNNTLVIQKLIDKMGGD